MADTLDPSVSGPACAKCQAAKQRVGKRWRCRPCEAEYQRAYMAGWLERNREKNRQASLKWAAEHREIAAERARKWHTENRERAAKASAQYYRLNSDELCAKNRAYYAANPEPFLVRARNSTWRKDNPAGARALTQRRKARLRDAICEHGDQCVNAEFLKALYAADCTYCGAPAEHADHFYPLARGGIHCRENIVPACSPCNERKSWRDPIEWLESLTA